MSSQICDGNLDTVFSPENQDFPLSLSTYGDIRTRTKSDILECLEKVSFTDVDILLLDGAVIVNMLRPSAVKTFHEYSQQVFHPFQSHS